MMEIKFSDEAKETMEQLLALWPIATRASYEKKMRKAAAFHFLQSGADQITRELLLEAIEEEFPKSFEPIILRFKDPKALSALAASQKKVDEKNPAIKVRRWDLPKVTIGRPVHDVLAMMAGPRKGGSTDCIMDALLEGVNACGCSVEKLYFSDLKISPCNGCLACEHKELETFCAIKDDMTQIYHRFLACDAFVIGFPIYTARECAQAATFFDRLKALRSPGHYKKLAKMRKGALVVTWGWPSGDSYDHVVESAAFVLKLFGAETAEVVTGAGFWEAYYKKGLAKLDEDGLAQARIAGKELASA